MIAGVVFDLDDTLYPESEYVRSGFRAVAAVTGTTDAERAELAAWLLDAFESGVRGDAFDRLRARFPEVARRASTADLVACYRGHRPELVLPADSMDTLVALAGDDLRLGIVTDGPVASQAAKVAALELDRWCAPVILTASLGPGLGKPDPTAFGLVAQTWALAPERLVYVGDNPRKDFAGPRGLGWRTVRLRREGQLHAGIEPASPDDAPDAVIGVLADLPSLVAGW